MNLAGKIIYVLAIVFVTWCMGEAKKKKDIYELLYSGFGLIAINLVNLVLMFW